MLHQFVCALSLCERRGGIVKHNVNDVHFLPVNVGNRHGAIVRTISGSITRRNNGIRFHINGKIREAVKLLFWKHPALCFIGFLLKFSRPCFRSNKIALVLVVFRSENRLPVRAVDCPVGLIGNGVKRRYSDFFPSPSKLSGLVLQHGYRVME